MFITSPGALATGKCLVYHWIMSTWWLAQGKQWVLFPWEPQSYPRGSKIFPEWNIKACHLELVSFVCLRDFYNFDSPHITFSSNRKLHFSWGGGGGEGYNNNYLRHHMTSVINFISPWLEEMRLWGKNSLLTVDCACVVHRACASFQY